MPVQIQVETNITLAELVAKKRAGFMVEETPHIGNLSVATLALLTLGMDAKLVDANVGAKDNLFYPHQQIINGQATTIASPYVMSTHNKVKGDITPVSEFHLDPVQRLGLKAFAHSKWIGDRRNYILTLLALLNTENWPLLLWTRYVDTNGRVSKVDPPTTRFELMCRIHKLTSSPDESGWILPNPINILLDLVFGALETDKPTVYMLSGQSMYRYISQQYTNFGRMDELISDMYDTVRSKGFYTLPELLKVSMVPIPVIRHFVAPAGLKNELDKKLDYYERLIANTARGGNKLSKRQISHDLMSHLKLKRKHVFSSLSSPLAHLCADSETGQFYSQHDLAYNNDQMYIPDRAMNLPIHKMAGVVARMVRLAK